MFIRLSLLHGIRSKTDIPSTLLLTHRRMESLLLILQPLLMLRSTILLLLFLRALAHPLRCLQHITCASGVSQRKQVHGIAVEEMFRRRDDILEQFLDQIARHFFADYDAEDVCLVKGVWQCVV